MPQRGSSFSLFSRAPSPAERSFSFTSFTGNITRRRTTASSMSFGSASGHLPAHVVIIGAGYAGSLLAKGLQDSVRRGIVRVTVIDRREFMHHKIAAFRASVTSDASWIRRSQIPLQKIVKYGKIILGEVSQVCQITKTIRFLDPHQPPIHFDILVAATGTFNLSPGDLPLHVKTSEDAQAYFESISHAIRESNQIAIVGGGPSAIELAGEIRSKYPTKRVTLITAGSTLMSSCVSELSEKFHTKLLETLEQRNIKVVFCERVVEPSPSKFADQKYVRNVIVRTQGELKLELHCDLAIWSAPVRTCTEIYPLEWVNELGELNVTSTFQLRARNDVFAFGDVTSLPETKQAITIPSKVPILVNNIEIIANAMNEGRFTLKADYKDLKRYRLRNRDIMYVSLGPDFGVSQISHGIVFGDTRTVKWKGKDLFCDYFWRKLTGSVATSGTCEPATQEFNTLELTQV